MIDSHCHLDFSKFDGRREATVAAAHKAGVHTIINIGIDVTTSQLSIDLAERFENVFATVGTHPHDARTFDKNAYAQTRDMAAHPKVKAIGEIGLDYYRDLSPRDMQQRVFRRQLELAAELSMPVVIHTRDAMTDTMAIVREFSGDLVGGVFHCFPGDAAEASDVIAAGFVVAVGGQVTFKNSRMAEMVPGTPLDKMLLETDAPFLAPAPFRGKTNSPEYIPYICDKVASLKGVTRAEVEKLTDRTCQKLFRLVDVFGE
jgi:TatD DNase family protein